MASTSPALAAANTGPAGIAGRGTCGTRAGATSATSIGLMNNCPEQFSSVEGSGGKPRTSRIDDEPDDEANSQTDSPPIMIIYATVLM